MHGVVAKIWIGMLIGLVLLVAVVPARSTVFVAWTVDGVAWNDVLNARAWPAATSAVRAGYPEGTVLQMTGRCMNGVDLHAISRLSAAAQKRRVARTWCQIWHDPTGQGDWQVGWVYGRYISPGR